MLLSLSSFYENADLSKHPRVCVIFNNVSKFDQIPSDETQIPWQDFITQYKEILLDVIKIAYRDAFDEQYLKSRIEKLLPDSNFYFFKLKESELDRKQEIA